LRFSLAIFSPFPEVKTLNRTYLKALVLFWLAALGMGCATAEKTTGGALGQLAKTPQAAPVITQSFASPKIAPGDDWKVYVKGSDPDGDMKDFICNIRQPGVGNYPVGITRIKEGNQKELSGYLFLDISTQAKLDFVEITLTVQIRDRSGQVSKPVEFPLSINSRNTQEPPPAGVFQENKLGPIMIQLRPVGGPRR
jgi:hypothetical protein